MAITRTDIVLRRAQTNNDTNSNGGRMTHQVWASGTTNALWPDVSEDQRTAGATQWRKVFIHVANANSLTLPDADVFLERPTEGDDEVYLAAGTQTDIQSDLSSPPLYGTGALNADVSAGASQIVAAVADGAVSIFRNSGKIRISDTAGIDEAGNTEFHTISGAPSVNGNLVTISLVGTLANDYDSENTTISSVYEAGDVEGAISNVVVTSAGGEFDDAAASVNAIGAVYQPITITFTSSTAFTCSGDTLGSLGAGSIAGTFAPVNQYLGQPYFSIPATAWSGTWEAGDTVTFTLSPFALPVWLKRVVPAGAEISQGNNSILRLRSA